MTPKFSVGEVAILQSVNRPELNGECTVLDIRIGMSRNVTTGKIRPSIVYKTTIELTGAFGWGEPALRKKHQPGDMSFTELMVNLSQPVEAPSHS